MDKEIEIHGKLKDLEAFMYILSQFTTLECKTLSDYIKSYNNSEWAFKDFKVTLIEK